MASVLDPGLEEVRQAAARARDIFEQMGAKPFLERLEASMSRPGTSPRSTDGIPAAGATG